MLIVLGAQLALVRAFGSVTPIWDQWDGEAAYLYKPYLEGSLSPWFVFSPHNEHRIFFSRALSLGLLELAGSWDTLLQMAVNAMLHALGAGLLVAALGASLGCIGFVALAAFASLILSVPYGHENVLAGFQSPFYFLLLFTFASFLALYRSRPFSARWWAGALLALASYLCLASGAFTLLAPAALFMLQAAIRRRRGAVEFIAILVQVLIVAVLAYFIPRIPDHTVLQAATFGDFLAAFMVTASWPFADGIWGVFALHLPVILLAAWLIAKRAPVDDARWVIVLLAIWLALQYGCLAIGRSTSVMAARYLDIYVIAALVNLASLFHLLEIGRSSRFTKVSLLAASTLWIVAVTLAAASQVDKAVKGVVDRYATSISQTTNLKNFLATGDFTQLADKPFMHIPYPSAERLRDVVSDPTILAVLPSVLIEGHPGPAPPAPAFVLGEGVHHATAGVKGWLLETGPMFLPLGIALLFVVAFLRPVLGFSSEVRSSSPADDRRSRPIEPAELKLFRGTTLRL